MTDTLAALVAARRAGPIGEGINGPERLGELLDALDSFIASPAYRVAALRADGIHVYPSGSPGFPRWTVAQLQGASWTRVIDYADSELAAIELGEATPL